MKPRILSSGELRLAGIRQRMTMTDNTTRLLWQTFVKERNRIPDRVGKHFVSVQIFDPDYFKQFDPDRSFEKWACVEVNGFDSLPDGMESLIIPGGLYAVFLHKGAALTAPETYQYIFNTWIPGSAYSLDPRPHFEILDDRYKNDDPDSEEEIWIPVGLK